MFFGPNVKAQNIGARNSFADMGQTLAKHFKINALLHGKLINFH
ncbi:Phosphopentomutase [hydrothermal vent metagenome]|uniref:Phosphopentomutase n=1 Tax=hydrothermal vent metagenome TaxID=652676 RepID=A0A3B0VID7_9ZZZZ